MRASPLRLLTPAVLVLLALPAGVRAQQSEPVPRPPVNPFPYSEHEPVAKQLSLAKSAEYLDGVAGFWMRTNSCGACHANFAYVMARPLLAGPNDLLAPTRQFLEAREPNPKVGFPTEAELVAVAFALAWDDARAGALRPVTRQALRRMWAIQRPTGEWRKMGCGEYMPAENDRRFLATLAAVAAGVAPDDYARTSEARDGLTRLRRYFMQNPPRSLHDEMMTLWASAHMDGLLTTEERAKTVRTILARQRNDGGWSFAMLTGESATQPSDGYATAFAVYVLRQGGVPADRPEITRAVRWLRANQRVSGRWFTPTHTANEQTEGGVGARDLYVQHLGTAFAVLALKECDALDGVSVPADRRQPFRSPGLSLRDRLMVE